MNVAIGAFMLTLLLIPAISLRLALYRHRYLKEMLHTLSVMDTMWLFIIVPVMTHTILLTGFHLLDYEVKYDLILHIISGHKELNVHQQGLGTDIICFLSYNLLAFALSMMLCFWVANGRASGRYIMTLLGADNEWYELLNGNCNSLHKHTIILDVLTATGEFTCLYSGIRNNYHFRSKSMELEYLVLTKVKRRDFGRPGSTVMLSSNFIVIPAKEILNISIAYVNMDDYLQSGLEQIPDSHHITPVEETLAPA